MPFIFSSKSTTIMKRIFALFVITCTLAACNNEATVDERGSGVTIDSTGIDTVPAVIIDTIPAAEGGKKIDTALVPIDSARKR